jgi:hypothetical protein
MREFRVVQVSYCGVWRLFRRDSKYALAESRQFRLGIEYVTEKAMDRRQTGVTRPYAISPLCFEHRKKL